ncbi:PQ loop repeat-domain-containing protein [Limtongia smithiae]|uniref:PQ loop repeat-domain-containing protein n=1 Tax=Limtongia smithiae TaxID=1125753 RepID=UPI0034CD373D
MADLYRNCRLTDDEGTNLVMWIAAATGSCVYGFAAGASWVFGGLFSLVSGYMSLFSWLWAQLPQVIANYRNHSVEGLSWLFLFNWFLGDFANFVGCLLTDQLAFQTLLATYYLIIDVALCSQYVYYTRISQQTYYVLLSPSNTTSRRSSVSSAGSDSSASSQATIRTSSRRRANIMLSLSAIVAVAGAMLVPPAPAYDAAPVATLAASNLYSTGVDVLQTATGGDAGGFNGLRRWFKLNDRQFIGRVFAWACTTLYLTSRLPQIYKNFVRQSTSGLSILLFIAAFCGNTFYTLSILSSAAALPEDDRLDFIWTELPYLLGSAGTVGFDITIFCQWVYYGEGKAFPEGEGSDGGHTGVESEGEEMPTATFASSSSSSSSVRSAAYTLHE